MPEYTDSTSPSSNNTGKPQPSGVRSRIMVSKERLDQEYLEIGRDLYIAFSLGKHKEWGYNRFDDYVKCEMGMEPGKARRMRRVFKVLQKDLSIPTSTIKQIGYSRASLILPVIDRTNCSHWVDKACNLSYDDLEKLVKASKNTKKKRKVVQSPPGSNPQSYQPEHLATSLVDERHKPSSDGKTNATDDDTIYEKTLYLVGDQADVFETAIEEMERETGSSKAGYLITCALLEFLAHRSTKERGKDGRIKYWMSILEKRYGGKLFWLKNDKAAKELQKAVGNSGLSGVDFVEEEGAS